MSIKLVVLYPPPSDPLQFERAYHAQHMPLMRRLITPALRTPTFRVIGPAAAPFYRMAEVHFPSIVELSAFASSEAGQGAQRSALHVSTGGPPTLVVCAADAM